ncbi:MAG: hypothetical protein F9K40_02045, partial [Kofleriaceae bacterium]
DDPEWRSRPAPDPDAPAPGEDLDPRVAARALADPALVDGPRTPSRLVPPWTFPFPQVPDERILRAAFAGKPILPVVPDVGEREGKPEDERELDEEALRGGRPRLAQHKPGERLRDKEGRRDPGKKPGKGDKGARRPGLSKAAAEVLEAQRKQAEKDYAADPRIKKKKGEKPGRHEKQKPDVEAASKDPAKEKAAKARDKMVAGIAIKEGAGSGVGGGGVGAAAVEQWQKQNVDKANEIPPPPAPDDQRFVTTFKDAEVKRRDLTPREKLKLLTDAEKAVTPAEQPDNVPKIPNPDDVGEARKVVAAKTKRKLPEQSLPDLEPTPLGNQPQVGMSLRMGEDKQLHVFQEVKGTDGKPREMEIKVVPEDHKGPPDKNTIFIKTPKPTDKTSESLDKLAESGKQQQAELQKQKGKKGKGITLAEGDTAPLKPPTVPDFAKVDVGDVVARALAAGKRANAVQVVEAARAAFAGGKMEKGEVSKFIESEEPLIEAELRKVATAAKVSEEALNAKVEKETKANAEKHDEARDKLDESYKSAKTVTHGGYEEKGDFIVELKEAIDRGAEEEYTRAQGGTDPKEVRRKQKQYNEESDNNVIWWRAEYKRAGERRVEQLKEAGRKQMTAYDAAAEIDYKQIDLQLKVKTLEERAAIMADPTKDGYKLYHATKAWVDQRKKELGVDVGKLIKKAGDEAEAYRIDIGAAGVEANKLIDAWADVQLGREKSWWKKLLDALFEWLGYTREKSKEWKDVTFEDNSANLAKDNIWLAKFQLGFSTDLTMEEVENNKSLTEEQKAMAKVMVASKGKDSAGALAAALVSRISQQRRVVLLRSFHDEVMTWGDSASLDRIGTGQGGNVSSGFAMAKAMQIYAAGVDQVGTNEGSTADGSGIFGALNGLTPIQGRAVERAYFEKYGRNLRTDLREEMYDWTQQLTGSRGDYDRSIQLLEGKGAAATAVEIHQAMKETFLGTGWGTDSEAVHRLLKGKNPAEIALIKAEYKRLYGKEMIAEVDSELDDGWSTQHDVQRFYATLRGDEKTARTIEADQAMRGSAFFGLKTDKKQLEGVYEQINQEVEKEAKEKGWDTERVQREIAKRYAELDQDYEHKYGFDFPQNKRKPGESALRTAMRDSFTWGTGKGAFNFTTSTGDLDILLSYSDVGLEKDSPDIKKVFQQHRAEVSTARVQIEHRGIFYSDDKEIDKALNAPSEAAYKDALRDEQLALDKQRDKAFDDLAERRAKELEKAKDPKQKKEILERYKEEEKKLRREWAPTGDAYAGKVREAKKTAEGKAAADAGVTFDMMKQVWKEKYQPWNEKHNFGDKKGFEEAIKGDTGLGWMNFDTSVDFWGNKRTAENDKTLALLAGKGFLSREDKLYFAIEGGGTDEDIAKEQFADLDSVESKELLARLGKKRLGISDPDKAAAAARKWVMGDFSGREGQDQEIAMMGVPRTPEEHLAIAHRRKEMEENSGPRRIANMAGTLVPAGGLLTLFPPTALLGAGILGTTALAKGMSSFDASSMEALDYDVKRFEKLKQEADELRAKGIEPGDPEWERIDHDLTVLQESLKTSVQIHRAQVDAMTDVITNVVTAVVTIAVIAISILAAPVTGGASAVAAFAAMTAVIGAVAATVTNIAVKMALKGDAYGWEEIGYDAAVGLVEAVASGLTAGLGDKFLKVGFLAKMAQGGLISRLAAHGLANAAEGVIQALPGALAGNILNDELMRGPNPLAAVLMGTVTQVGMAGGMSGVMGGLFGGVRKPKQFITPGASQYDDLFDAYQKKFPGATHEKFRTELHVGIIKGDHPSLGKQELADVARDTMLSGADKETQKAFKKVKVEVVTPEEFTALTKSQAKGEAVVMFRNGEPTVVVKAGTDFKNLHRELPHLTQSLAEDTRRLVAKLDEALMDKWPHLPIEQQVDMYKAKFELEIKAHEQMLDGLGRKAKKLGEAGVESERDYLEQTLINLRKKAKEVDHLDIDAIKAGQKKPPPFWDDPPRLFSKETEVKFGTWKKAIDAGAVDPDFELNRNLTRAEVGEAFDNGYVVVKDELSDSIPKLRRRLGPDGNPVDIKEEKILVATKKSGVEGGPKDRHLEFKVVDRGDYPDPPEGHYWAETGETGEGAQKYQLRKLSESQVTAKTMDARPAKVEALKELEGQRWVRKVDDQGKVTWDKEIVADAEHDWATRRKNLAAETLDRPAAPEGFQKRFEDKLDATQLPPGEDTAIIRRWAKSMEEASDVTALLKRLQLIPDSGDLSDLARQLGMSADDLARKLESDVPLDKAFEALQKKIKTTPPGPLTETQYDAFRGAFREEFGKMMADLPEPLRMKLMLGGVVDSKPVKGLLDLLPDPASKGHFFREFVRADLARAVTDVGDDLKVPRIKLGDQLDDFPLQHKTPPGTKAPTRDFDDVYDVDQPLGPNGPEKGIWLAEYKSGPGAFKVQQALDYAAMLEHAQRLDFEATGSTAVKEGFKPQIKQAKGVAMVFDNKASAVSAMEKLAEAEGAGGDAFRKMFGSQDKPGFHIGFYNKETGKLEFIPRQDLDAFIETLGPKKPPPPGPLDLPAAGSAAFVPGSKTFRGVTTADWRPNEVTHEAVNTFKTMKGLTEIPPPAGAAPGTISTRYKLELHSGDVIEVRVISRSMGTEATADVANFEYVPEKRTAVIQISDRASPDAVARAMHHDVAEIREALSGKAGAIDLLSPGSRPPTGARLSPHDAGRVAELDYLARKLAADPGNPELRREVLCMVEVLGLRGDLPGAKQRLALVKRRLDGDAVATIAPLHRPARKLSPADRRLLEDVRRS